MLGNEPNIIITNRQLDYVMNGKDRSIFHNSYYLTAITFLILGIIVTSIFGCTLTLFNQNQPAMAQQQQESCFKRHIF